jgi:hypothetical protein
MSGGRLHWSISDIGLTAPLQRTCACGECETCRQKNENAPTLQRKPLALTEAGAAPAIVHQVLNSPGQQLDKPTRDFFEPRFGYDLSGVRVHHDSMAAESARAVNAAAYTVGRHVVLSDRPTTSTEQRKLLAHELTHTLQQSPAGELSGSGRRSNPLNVSTISAPVIARQNDKNQQTPPPPRLRSTGLTAGEAAQLQQTRNQEFNLPPGKSTLVGILVDDETGKRYPVHSGEFGGPSGGTHRGNVPRGQGEGFSSGAPTEKNIGTHIEGHAASIMHEQKIRRATLLSPEPPCHVCSSPTRTPAVSVVLPPESRLTVVYPGGAETFWSSALPSGGGTPKGSSGAASGSGEEGEGGGTSKTASQSGGAPEPVNEEPRTSTKVTAPAEEDVEGVSTRRIRTPGELVGAEPGFTRTLGFAALNFAAGVGTSFMQGYMRTKIAEDLANLPQPKRDKRGVWEFLNDPGTKSAVRLLDVLSKDIKPYTAEFQPQHTKIMTTGLLELAAIALLPSKSKEDIEKRFARLDDLKEEMSGYEEELSTVRDNLDALLEMEPQAKQTKAACDDLIAKLPTMFTVQAATSSAFGFVPVPDPEDYSKMDSNLRYLSASIGMVFADAHSAKTVIDKAVQEAAGFRSNVSKIWSDEFAALFSALMKERAASSAAKPQAPPTPPPAKAAVQQQGPQLLPTLAPVQQEQKWEPLPGAPGPSPFREVEAKKDMFAKQALNLIARGNQILSSSSDREKAAAFKRDEENWRTVVTAWFKHYQQKGPDTGVSAMQELLESDQYGERLKQILQSLGV